MADTPKTAKPKRAKPPKLLRVYYSVKRTTVVELDGSRFHFYREERTGLRKARPLLVDEPTWAKLQSTAPVQRMLGKGQILRTEVAR